MRQRGVQRSGALMVITDGAPSRTWRIGALTLSLALVVSLLAGCVIVPVGYGYEHERHWYGYYRHERHDR